MTEPVTLAQARFQARMGSDATDEIVMGYIARASAWVETTTGHLLTQRQITIGFDGFDRLRLSPWPVAAETAVLTYRDLAGVDQMLPVRVVATSRPARVLPAVGAYWPAIPREAGAVSITLTAGYATAADIPPQLVQAMLLLIAAYYVDREGGETLERSEKAARSLCDPFRMWSV